MKQAPQKIIIIGPAHPLRGGLAAYNERLAQAFQQQGHEVSLFSFSMQYPDFLFPGKTQYSEEPAPPELDIHPQINSVNPINWWLSGRRIRKMKPDLVVCAFWLPFMAPSLGTILRIIKKNKHTKVVGLIHNIVPHEQRPGDSLLARYFVNSADGFIVMSKAVAEDLSQFTKKQTVTLIPHPVYDSYGEIESRSEALTYLKLDAKTRYILFFGFIRAYKGLDLLIQAMADPRIRQLDLRLIIAGEFYEDEQAYRDLIFDMDVEKQLILKTEFIPDSELRHYFCAADLIVQPYKSATQSGISQLASHFEKPMVVTAVGGLPEIIKHGESGYVVSLEPDAIADAIVDFYKK